MRLLGSVLALLLLAAVPAQAAPGPRIVGGEDATTSYPAHAEVEAGFGFRRELCGGTLIAPQWVLTAAHCATDQTTGNQVPPTAFVARLGSDQLGIGQPHFVDAVLRAPDYDNAALDNDAALLHLTSIPPEAPLPLLDDATLDAARSGVLGRVLGWGLTAENGTVSSMLQQVDVPIVDDPTCEAAYPGLFRRVSMVCAGLAEGGRDACQGDSGGPLMVPVAGGFALAGIVSTGDGCGQPGRYGIYTRLARPELRAWIAGVVPEVAAAQQAARAKLQAPPEIARLRACGATRCRASVRFAAGGQVRAVLSVSPAVRRRLDLGRRRIALATARVVGTDTAAVALDVRRAVRRAIGRAGKRAVAAKLSVAAQTPTGLRAGDSRAVRLRGVSPR